MKFQSFRSHKLRRYDQNLTAVKCKEIRALPHFSITVFTLVDHFLVVPVDRILGSKECQLTASVFCLASDQREKLTIFFPDLRIAEIDRRASFRQTVCGDHWVFRHFFIRFAVTDRNTLCLAYHMGSVFEVFFQYAGIHQDMFSFMFYGCSGKASLSVVFHIRCHRARKFFPFDKIFCLAVSPVHRAPFVLIWIILIKQMVFIPKSGKSVRIVTPSGCRRYMKRRTLVLIPFLFFLCFICDCFC